jgi:hypothetical protein
MVAICGAKSDLTIFLEVEFMDEVEHEEYPNADL